MLIDNSYKTSAVIFPAASTHDDNGSIEQVTPKAVRRRVRTVLLQAREKHEEAHILWEYWTAENSDGFHKPDLARESLTSSIAASKAGVKILNDAMAVVKKDEVKK